MRVLLTGPSGFIGRHAIPYLQTAGCELHTVDIRPLDDAVTGLSHHAVDLLDARRVRELMTEIRPSHLLHFAWCVTPGAFWTSPDNVRWLQASLDLVAAFLDCGGQRSVIAGTCAEYDWTGGEILREDHTPVRPSSLYGASKAALQLVHARLASLAGSSFAWGRIFHLYGPFEPESRLVPSVIRSILGGQAARCTHGRQVRDFMHVDDVARAFVALLQGSAEGVVNIATGQGVQIAEVTRRIADILGRPDLLCLGALPEAASDPPTLVADARRLHSLGFVPAYSLDGGLRQTINWWTQRSAVQSDVVC
jgi:nucleoside-diphosphate-sugar epimerase